MIVPSFPVLLQAFDIPDGPVSFVLIVRVSPLLIDLVLVSQIAFPLLFLLALLIVFEGPVTFFQAVFPGLPRTIVFSLLRSSPC